MDIKKFKFSWRYTDEKYALFTSNELLQMGVVSEKESARKWDEICDNRIFQKSSYIKLLINQKLPVFISDAGWGEMQYEYNTKEQLLELFSKYEDKDLFLLYDRHTGLKVSKELFCNKWSDFCYPSDANLILFYKKILIYYEDSIYGPIDLTSIYLKEK